MRIKFIDVFARIVLAWCVLAFAFQVTMLTLSVINPELETKIGNEITWTIDGTFNK